MGRCEVGRGSVRRAAIDRVVRPRPCVVGHHTMKLPAGSRPYPCDSLSNLNPSSPSTSSIDSIPDLIPVEDIPLPGESSTIGPTDITFTPLDPIDETRVIDSAISLLAFWSDRIEDKVYGGR